MGKSAAIIGHRPGEELREYRLLCRGPLQDPPLNHRGPVKVCVRDEDNARAGHRRGGGVHQGFHLRDGTRINTRCFGQRSVLGETATDEVSVYERSPEQTALGCAVHQK